MWIVRYFVLRISYSCSWFFRCQFHQLPFQAQPLWCQSPWEWLSWLLHGTSLSVSPKFVYSPKGTVLLCLSLNFALDSNLVLQSSPTQGKLHVCKICKPHVILLSVWGLLLEVSNCFGVVKRGNYLICSYCWNFL